MIRWELRCILVQCGVREDADLLQAVLDQGYEPFAVTDVVRGQSVFYLRRVVPNDATDSQNRAS